MYVPTSFKQENEETIWNFVRDYSFGTLVSLDGSQISACHIPFEVESFGDAYCLTGHIAKANDQRIQLENGSTVMATFLGPHAYISPTWYDHVNVPTWNYAAVHIYGRAEVINDRNEVVAFLTRMVDRYESGSERPYRVDSLPDEFLDKFLPQIVVFRIVPSQVRAAFKLSQNRHEADFKNIIRELQKRGSETDRDLAKLMTLHGTSTQ